MTRRHSPAGVLRRAGFPPDTGGTGAPAALTAARALELDLEAIHARHLTPDEVVDLDALERVLVELELEGWIERDGDLVRLTDAGRRAIELDLEGAPR